MKTSLVAKIAAALACVGVVNLAMALGDRDSVVTAVFSRSFNNYERPLAADGSPEIQTYVIAKGGYAPGFGKDPSIDDVKFAGIVRVIGKYLAKQSYYPAKDSRKADLMLVVHWGKTIPFNHGTQRDLLDLGVQHLSLYQQLGGGIGRSPGFNSPTQGVPQGAAAGAATDEMVEGLMTIQFSQALRASADQYNANLLGYTGELRRYGGGGDGFTDSPVLFAGGGAAYYDLVSDIESDRYYIAITAYDFQDMLRHKHKKGLWRTVASIDARDNRFDERLAQMVDDASHYFGKDSERLVRQFEYTPHVSLGELKVLGVVDEKPAAGDRPAEKK
ncbi:MAG TPA: hypothetical protein VG710_07130 [Opitutus sp.]|nr:hypothetical protein [Opitutus sp.]